MIETLFLLSVQSHILQIGRCTVYWAVVFRKLQCVSGSDAWLKSSFKQSEWIYISLLKETHDYPTAEIRLESSIIWQRILKREGHRERPCFYFFFITFPGGGFRTPAREKELLFPISDDDNKKLTAEPNHPIMTQMRLHLRNKRERVFYLPE